MNLPKQPTSTELRLSALRAFMGEITSDMRLIKIKAESETIILSVIFDPIATPESIVSAQVAATEIIADFPDCSIRENFQIWDLDIPTENIITEGWIYRRKES